MNSIGSSLFIVALLEAEKKKLAATLSSQNIFTSYFLPTTDRSFYRIRNTNVRILFVPRISFGFQKQKQYNIFDSFTFLGKETVDDQLKM